MKLILKFVYIVTLFCLISFEKNAAQGQDCAEIDRRLPPLGRQPSAEQTRAWRAKIQKITRELRTIPEPHKADIEVLAKAVELAIRHQEFYKKNDEEKPQRLLALAEARIAEFRAHQRAVTSTPTLLVRGYRSSVDGSAQPIGLVLPELKRFQPGKKLPLYVWLHGRGDKATDLHFICERLDRVGQINPPNAIVLHPFGRQCVGYKSAGETDVLEAIDFVCQNYPVDPERIILMGFSMGGAGVWHLTAHYGERFAGASCGCGVRRNGSIPTSQARGLSPKYEQTLWSIYDCPGYVRNFFNLPYVAYSGEKRQTNPSGTRDGGSFF